MKKSFHNIEKSAFRKGEYIGYTKSGRVLRIKKSISSYGNWWAYEDTQDPKVRPNIKAFTLAAMSEKLESYKHPVKE